MRELSVGMKDICLLLGIAPQTVRLYEQRGLEPRYTQEENGYRHFYIEDLSQLHAVRDLARLGKPLEECTALFGASDAEAFEKTFSDLADGLARRREELGLLERAARRNAEAMSRFRDIGPEYLMCDEPEMWHLPCTFGGKLPPDPDLREQVGAWAKMTPMTFFTFWIDAEDLGPGCSSDCGYGVEAEFAGLVDTSADAVQHLPAHTCVVWAWMVDLALTKGARAALGEETDDYYPVYEGAVSFAAQRGYRPCGTVVGRLVAGGVDVPGVGQEDFYLMRMPVEQARGASAV